MHTAFLAAVLFLVDCVGTEVDTLFFSDPHVGEAGITWDAVSAAFANFRKTYPNAPYLVYTGDTIMHKSEDAENKADEYMRKFIQVAVQNGFQLSDMLLAQGNNDGPHDQPLSPKWAETVASSGLVPELDVANCKAASYYSKCLSNGVCAIVVNTDLEVYSTNDPDSEDKMIYRSDLAEGMYERILASRQEQQAWVAAKADELMKSGKSFFIMGHHPKITNLYNTSWASRGFLGHLAGHLHMFFATDKYSPMETGLPGYTASFLSAHAYAFGSIAQKPIQITSDNLVHFDSDRQCFYPHGESCHGAMSVVV